MICVTDVWRVKPDRLFNTVQVRYSAMMDDDGKITVHSISSSGVEYHPDNVRDIKADIERELNQEGV